MSELRDWLRQNKFEQYIELFQANDIDLDVLSELTEGDLEKLGVSLGNRRRMLKAFAARAAKAPKSPSETPVEAERRQVTVLFSDMVGSTALSSKFDPELFSSILRRYQDTVAGAIIRFGGFVAKFLGDGVLAYFGYPRAFEDAAERAVRAARDILSDAGDIELPDGTRVQTRIGIATGLVVVGEIVGTGSAQERTIVGETPNLAARLQAAAEPNNILISDTTQRLLGGLFELESIGPKNLKGFSTSVVSWRVAGEASVKSRFAAIRAGTKLPLVGRAHEMGLILERWGLARIGEGQIVTLTGEAGIGKSRCVEALQESIVGERHTCLQMQCSPYHSDSALYPVIQHLSRAATFAAADSSAERLEKLRAAFAQRAAADPDAIQLLAELLSILPAEGSATPAQRKTATISLLIDEIVQISETDPVLLVLEDAHWIDATTLEFITRLIGSIGQTRLLILVTARSDFSPPWLGRPFATLLTLGRLSRAECAQLISGVAALTGLSPETIAVIVGKTDGVPLFAEELTKNVIESAGDGGIAVPATLKDSLMARLDRLGDARELAQVAAVIGRHFPISLLEAVALKSTTDLEAGLGKLLAAEIVMPEGRGADRSFTFKHALLRDAAYDSLLLARRRQWHERIADALEQHFVEVLEKEPELLAYHFAEAGLNERASMYRLRAGDRAVGRSAYPEAKAHYAAGLKLVEALPEAAESSRRKLEFLLKLGPALLVLQGMQSAEAEMIYQQAAEIGAATDDKEGTFKAKWGLWMNANIRRKTALARDRASELVSLAQASGNSELILEAYHCRWSTAFFRGDVNGALADGQIGMEAYDIERHRHLGILFGGHDPGVCAHGVSALALQVKGEAGKAAPVVARMIELGEALDHPNSLAHALYEWGLVSQIADDRPATREAALRLAALAEKFRLLPYRPASAIWVAWADANKTGFKDAAQVIDAEIEHAISTGPIPQYALGIAAEILLGAGRAGDALAHIERAIAGIEEPSVGFYLPEIYRLRGECLLALDRAKTDEATVAFETARTIAERQGAFIFAQRAEASLARLSVSA